jgi:hypothetical protein
VIVDQQWQPILTGAQPMVISGTAANEIHKKNLEWEKMGGG